MLLAIGMIASLAVGLYIGSKISYRNGLIEGIGRTTELARQAGCLEQMGNFVKEKMK